MFQTCICEQIYNIYISWIFLVRTTIGRIVTTHYENAIIHSFPTTITQVFQEVSIPIIGKHVYSLQNGFILDNYVYSTEIILHMEYQFAKTL
jgi:uncharacterized membrane protein